MKKAKASNLRKKTYKREKKMKKVKRKIRYKYREEKEGFLLKNVRCPTCKSNRINWIKVVEHTSWAGRIKLLAECWSGNTREEKPAHLFLIELNDLPIVKVNKVKPRK